MRNVTLAILIAAFLPSWATAQDFNLDWFTVDGGGAMSSVGGVFEVSGTIGQTDAGSPAAPLAGGDFELVGGFWALAGGCACPGDVNSDCQVTLTDLAALLSAFGCCQADACYVEEADINLDGCIDLADLAVLLSTFGTSCG